MKIAGPHADIFSHLIHEYRPVLFFSIKFDILDYYFMLQKIITML